MPLPLQKQGLQGTVQRIVYLRPDCLKACFLQYQGLVDTEIIQSSRFCDEVCGIDSSWFPLEVRMAIQHLESFHQRRQPLHFAAPTTSMWFMEHFTSSASQFPMTVPHLQASLPVKLTSATHSGFGIKEVA